MSEKSAAAKLERLRAGETRSDEAAIATGESAAYRQLRELLVLDERLRIEGDGGLLEDLDHAIVDGRFGYVDWGRGREETRGAQQRR